MTEAPPWVGDTLGDLGAAAFIITPAGWDTLSTITSATLTLKSNQTVMWPGSGSNVVVIPPNTTTVRNNETFTVEYSIDANDSTS